MSAATHAAVRERETRALTAGELTWLAVLPVALVVVAAIAWLGPPLGETFLTRDGIEPWPAYSGGFLPEPAEQGRFLVALSAPLLLAAATALGTRRVLQLPAALLTPLVVATQAALLAFLVVCVVAQRQLVFGELYTLDPAISLRRSYFTDATLLAAAVLTAAFVAAIRSAPISARFAALTRETPARRVVVAGVATLFVALWLSHAFNTESTIAAADPEVPYHLQFPLDEAFAVLNGRSPLVDFTSQYGFLVPYAFAGVMALLGDTVGVYVGAALLATGAALLAIYAVLRRLTGSSLTALLLFMPFVATAFFLGHGELDNRYTFATLFGSYPARFAGPFVLCWLVARRLDGDRPRHLWLLFLAGALVVLNNTDTGLPALGATVAALLWAGGRPTRDGLLRLAVALVAGTAVALALVSALTLARTGSLPDLALLTYFSRVFAIAGFGSLPMPTLGLHLVVYLTYVAAIAVATVRAVSGDAGRTLTGMLAWCGVFGLGAGAYYVGRSHPESLIATFSIWSLTLALLLIVVARALARRGSGWPRPAELACMLGFAVAVCSLAQTPTPWGQLDRLQATTEPALAAPPGQAFVDTNTRRGEPVAILLLLGHRMGVNVGVTNVSPYAGSLSMPLVEQLDHALAALRDAGGRKVFFSLSDTPGEALTALQRNGFSPRAEDPDSGTLLWAR